MMPCEELIGEEWKSITHRQADLMVPVKPSDDFGSGQELVANS